MYLDLDKLKHTTSGQFFLFAGPCVIEGEDMAMEIAEKCVEITNKLKIPYVFKGSFKKANRSSTLFLYIHTYGVTNRHD